MNIILLAPPAAGKGTQSKLLEDHYRLKHLSTGDLLRDALKEESEISLKLKEVMSSGKLVSDDIILKLIEETITQEAYQEGYILDGFPRTKLQALEYDALLKKLNKKVDYVFHFKVNKEILKKRIVGRLQCKNCGSIYNEFFEVKFPKIKGFCDICNHSLTKRSDDNEQTFEKRYSIYVEETEPLIDYYEKQGILYNIPFYETPNEVFLELRKIIEGKND